MGTKLSFFNLESKNRFIIFVDIFKTMLDENIQFLFGVLFTMKLHNFSEFKPPLLSLMISEIPIVNFKCQAICNLNFESLDIVVTCRKNDV